MPLSYKSLAGGSNLTSYVSAAATGTVYSSALALSAGVYTITCASSTVANVEFFNGTTYIGTATTVSGTVSYNLASAATRITYYINTGSNITIGILQTGNPVTAAVSGTLDTITSTSTYTATGNTGVAYVVVVGGGGGGGAGRTNDTYSGAGGGGSGGVSSSISSLTGNVSVTIGTGGNGGAAGATAGNGNAGGATTFGNITANGGLGGSGFNAGGNAQATGGSAALQEAHQAALQVCLLAVLVARLQFQQRLRTIL